MLEERGMPRGEGEGELDPARLRAELAQLAPTDQIRVLRDLIARQVRDVLGAMAPDDIDIGLSFQNLGFDSRAAVELRDRLRATTGVELTAAVAFDYPTIERMAQLLHIRLTGLELGEADTDPQAVTAPEEPIAIIGLACRYPGGIASPEDLWEMLADERDVVSDFPTDRGWSDIYDPEPGAVGKSYVRSGGFLYDAPLFDAAFFDISPREATAMDPQQRLLLEVAWEAIEHARIAPTSLRGSRTGVYAGQFYTDYADDDAPPELHGYLMTGVTGSVASGRVSYALGLEGPAVTVDTACSSSLVTLHLAAQALRRGECEMALAAGVTVMPKPKSFIGFSLQRGLAPDGRCKSYGTGADGTVWSEGVGVLVLERLSQAQRRGRRILAVIRGSAVNQDGASNGLAAPHGPAQERVIRAALADAGIGGADVDVVEGHGTGTVLGDPIEVQALLSTYGRARAAAGPLWLGSVKSNMGHTQAAAGVAGVIKTVMAMRHEIMPRTLYADHATEHVNWDDGEVQVLASARPWPRRERARRAGISSFGISGTNAHVIIEEPPREPTTPADRSEPPVTAWVLCARTDTAVSAQAGRLLTALRENADPAAVDIGYSLAVTRAEFARRSVLLGTDRAGLLAALEVLAEEGDSESVVRGVADRDARTALLFPGQGAQRPGMCRRLYDAYPLFAQVVDEMCTQFDAADPQRQTSLRAVLFAAPGTPEAELLDETGYTQPALFTVEVALFRLMCSWGVRPDYLAGHSIGEIAAAYVAGVWSLTDACALVAARSRLMQALPRGGATVAVEAAEEDVTDLVAERADRISLAAVNSPRSLVLSGDEDAVAEVATLLAERGTRTKRLIVSHAFHSPRMEPMLAEFRRICAGLTYHGAAIPVISTVTGAPLTDDELRSPDYWVDQVRRPVRFLDATRRLLGPEGVSVLWEVGPGTVLTGLVHRTASDSENVPTAVPMLRDPGSDGEQMDLMRGLSIGYCAGARVDWAGMYSGTGARIVDLPTYAFQRQRFWLEPIGGADVRGAGLAEADHPLLGALVELPDTATRVWTGLLSLRTHPWLADHDIAGNVLLPGTAYVDIALYAGTATDCPHLAELVLQAPLVLPDTGAVEFRVVVGAGQEDGSRTVTIHSRPQSDSDDAIEWSCHAEGVVRPEAEQVTAPVDFAVWPPSGAEKVELEGGYDQLADRGYRYGAVFRGLTALWRRGQELFAEVDLPEQARGSAERFGVHPALLDSALHALALGGPAPSGDEVSVPFSWEGVTLHAVGADSLRVRLAAPAPDRITLTLADPAGNPVAEVAGLALRTLPRSALTAASAVGMDLLATRWAPLARFEITDAVTWDSVDGIDTVTLGELSARVLRTDFHTEDSESVLGTPEFVRARVARLLSRVQPLLTSDSGDEPIIVVTRHAVAVHDAETVDLTGAAVWGLLRSAQTENPGRLLLVDTDEWENYRDAAVQALAATGEPQLAVRNGLPHTVRLARTGGDIIAALPDDAPWRLRPQGLGTLTPDNLALVADEEVGTPLLPGQVRIEVRSAGVNFRDVLIVLGMYPDPEAGIGGEGAGVIVEVAADVIEFAPGDRVFGFIPAVASTAVVDRRLLARMPRGWTFAQAAAAPVVFATAYYGLVDLAGLGAGETLLLHAATGGVGMAAIQLARHLGAELYVTASEPKWNVLRGMGFDDDRIGDSRSLDFERKFAAATGGRGVDVVLDSLAGEFVDASLRLLPRGGRFIEMGMTDRREPEKVAERHPGVRYRSFHLMEAGPDRLREILTILVDLFESGALQPIPITCWHVREAAETLRFMSQARHIGKNVLTLPVPWRPDGTVLITGGTGGLGAVIARHLVTVRGVRQLVLVSRRGPAAAGAAELAAELSALGAEVSVVAADISEPQAISKLLSEIPADHPLTAVVHAAGVLDDVVFESLTGDRLATVFKPKVDAAWRLHEATTDSDLAAFVLYSSVAGVLGGPGQANYAAANAFLDALARQRRIAGLPATAVAWGAWRGSSGMTTELSDQDWARMRRQGMRPIDDAHGAALFDAAIAGADEAVVAARWDTAALSAQDPADIPPALRGLARAPRRTAAARSAESAKFIAGLSGLDAAGQAQAIVDALRVQAAAVLGHRSPEAIDPTRPFQELGFDSLGVMEFRNRLKSALGIALAATVVFDHPTPAALAEYLRTEIVPVDDAPARLRAGIEAVARDCAAAQLGPEDRRDLAVRLRAVVRELDAGVDGVSVDLDTADDSELFGLIDQLD